MFFTNSARIVAEFLICRFYSSVNHPSYRLHLIIFNHIGDFIIKDFFITAINVIYFKLIKTTK